MTPIQGNVNFFPQRPAQGPVDQNLLGIQQALFQLTSILQQQTLSPQQIAIQQQQQREAEMRAAAVNGWANDQMSRMMAQQSAIQSSFASSMQGLSGIETSLGGFLNQTFSPFSFGSFGAPSPISGGFSPQIQSSPIFGGPIAVPTFFAQRSGFRRF